MSRIILRVSGQDDFTVEVPDGLLDGRPLYFPLRPEISIMSVSEGKPVDDSLPTKAEFHYLGVEEDGKDNIMVYVPPKHSIKQDEKGLK